MVATEVTSRARKLPYEHLTGDGGTCRGNTGPGDTVGRVAACGSSYRNSSRLHKVAGKAAACGNSNPGTNSIDKVAGKAVACNSRALDSRVHHCHHKALRVGGIGSCQPPPKPSGR